MDEAAIELWKRKDAADAAQIADFRAAARLPSEEGLRKGYPSSDDEPETAAIPLEGSSKKSSKKKIKKFIGNLESAMKKPKSAKKAATKEDPKSKSTPIKLADGAPSKPKIILRETKTEKTGTSKKSKKGEVASKSFSHLHWLSLASTNNQSLRDVLVNADLSLYIVHLGTSKLGWSLALCS